MNDWRVAQHVVKLSLNILAHLIFNVRTCNFLSILTDAGGSYVQNIRRSVREAALSLQPTNLETSQDCRDGVSEHFFVPLSGNRNLLVREETKLIPKKSKRLFASEPDTFALKDGTSDHIAVGPIDSTFDAMPDVLQHLDLLEEYDKQENGFSLVAGSDHATSDTHSTFYDIEDSQDQVFSPPLLMDTTFFADSYEDLLGMFLSILNTESYMLLLFSIFLFFCIEVGSVCH